ncbi:MAG: GIY-YIG nuclease family protein [Polymorphobacter sp.]
MPIDRKAAIAAYKDRSVAAGVYAIRCPPSGEIWLGQATDLAAIQNRHWFSLRLGAHVNRAMQAAWARHGADALTFEPLQLMPDSDDPAARSRQLQAALRAWRAELAAPAA